MKVGNMDSQCSRTLADQEQVHKMRLADGGRHRKAGRGIKCRSSS